MKVTAIHANARQKKHANNPAAYGAQTYLAGDVHSLALSGQSLQLEPIKGLWPVWINGVGKREIAGTIKLICCYGYPLRRNQVGRDHDVVWPTAASARPIGHNASI